jgi:hypothetical protein
MNWRQFIVALIQALAWPTVAAVVLLAYRRRISSLLGDNLRRLKAGPIEAEWEKVAEETRATIEAVEAAPDTGDSGEFSYIENSLKGARNLAYREPGVAIEYAYEAAWATFESHRHQLLNPGAAVAFNRLKRMLRVIGDQGREATPEQAREFIELVEEFLRLLDKPTTTPRPRAGA